jgi:hypothetical protein
MKKNQEAHLHSHIFYTFKDKNVQRTPSLYTSFAAEKLNTIEKQKATTPVAMAVLSFQFGGL